MANPTSIRSGESRLLGYVGLFSSVSTLLCCALPSLLVLLGFGATVGSLLSAMPFLVTLSRHKAWIFAASTLLIVANFYYVYRVVPRLLVQRGTCPADDPEACARATRFSRLLLWCSTVLMVVGGLVAYILPIILERLDA